MRILEHLRCTFTKIFFQGCFPKVGFPSGSFPNVQFPISYVCSSRSAQPQCSLRRLRWPDLTLNVHFGNCHLRSCPWEKTSGKVPHTSKEPVKEWKKGNITGYVLTNEIPQPKWVVRSKTFSRSFINVHL